MAARVITVNRDTRPGIYPILIGMGLTLKNMLKTLFGHAAATIQFPEQKRPTSTRYRGIHVLTQREDGTPKCVACYMCATVCPAECIFIEDSISGVGYLYDGWYSVFYEPNDPGYVRGVTFNPQFNPGTQDKGGLRHNGGATYIFMDGHAHWYRAEQIPCTKEKCWWVLENHH